MQGRPSWELLATASVGKPAPASRVATTISSAARRGRDRPRGEPPAVGVHSLPARCAAGPGRTRITGTDRPQSPVRRGASAAAPTGSCSPTSMRSPPSTERTGQGLDARWRAASRAVMSNQATLGSIETRRMRRCTELRSPSSGPASRSTTVAEGAPRAHRGIAVDVIGARRLVLKSAVSRSCCAADA